MACNCLCCGCQTCTEAQEGKCCCGGSSGTCCQPGEFCCSGVCQPGGCDECSADGDCCVCGIINVSYFDENGDPVDCELLGEGWFNVDGVLGQCAWIGPTSAPCPTTPAEELEFSQWCAGLYPEVASYPPGHLIGGYCCSGLCQYDQCCPCTTVSGLDGTVTVTFSDGYGINCVTTPIEVPITSLTNCTDGLYAATVDIDIDFCDPPPTGCGSLTLYFRVTGDCNCSTGEGCTVTLDGYDDSGCEGVVSVTYA